jgi:hypothetical protein
VTEALQIHAQPIDVLSGKGRIWGTADPRYWPCLTPGDTDRVIELPRDRVPVN